MGHLTTMLKQRKDRAEAAHFAGKSVPPPRSLTPGAPARTQEEKHE